MGSTKGRSSLRTPWACGGFAIVVAPLGDYPANSWISAACPALPLRIYTCRMAPGVRPLNKDHAIAEVIFLFVLEQPFAPSEVEVLKPLQQILKEQLPIAEMIQNFTATIQPGGQPSDRMAASGNLTPGDLA